MPDLIPTLPISRHLGRGSHTVGPVREVDFAGLPLCVPIGVVVEGDVHGEMVGVDVLLVVFREERGSPVDLDVLLPRPFGVAQTVLTCNAKGIRRWARVSYRVVDGLKLDLCKM
jgi:hypothetical protein